MSIVPMNCSTRTEPLMTDTAPPAAKRPERASLWLVDSDGIGIGKPMVHDLPIAEVHSLYYRLTQHDNVDPKTLRITEAGKRPDSLGYQK